MNGQIIKENLAYWTKRAPGYSAVNQNELQTMQRYKWSAELCRHINAHFSGILRQDIRVLEVGTGPGFFAIILAEAGFQVTAIDLTPAMLEEARHNAGSISSRIHFLEMNAQQLSFEDNSFDVIVTRNLTWNLPDPEAAYREWCRVLRPDGLLLNFDANWYRYLYDGDALKAYEEDRRNTVESGYEDGNIGKDFDVMEDIARRVPLSGILRPEWDRDLLESFGCRVDTDTGIWQHVWSEEEKINYASTPQFLVKAVMGKPQPAESTLMLQ